MIVCESGGPSSSTSVRSSPGGSGRRDGMRLITPISKRCRSNASSRALVAVTQRDNRPHLNIRAIGQIDRSLEHHRISLHHTSIDSHYSRSQRTRLARPSDHVICADRSTAEFRGIAGRSHRSCPLRQGSISPRRYCPPPNLQRHDRSHKGRTPVRCVCDRVTQPSADGEDLPDVQKVMRRNPHHRIAQGQTNRA